ncbi:hypothetical protein [Paenibacillus alvei]|uniref:CbbX AAA lid domain-containing protein n=1 Tax=Paenibacillus alvei TaxID=44250 RepID=A0AAP7A0Z4_PAEAL|nr:hypothetical protein [Paenibacillus alvei]MBG9736204.1 hypothetical protein [Paenibacillus alvei]MBG9745903.1 hypothetical protein [Paenibacillus alvei]MCY9582695.1 hypothetical protein [Paenibacillus alvei]MCY9587959.1 hypothetical protein [Paenibacillus alvei]NOJ73609.1 hypothetical protein [Paenibacillus alvei]
MEERLHIAELIAKDLDYVLMPTIQERLKQVMLDEKILVPNLFSNARFVRNVMESAAQSGMRLLQLYPQQSPGKLEIMTKKPEDLK